VPPHVEREGLSDDQQGQRIEIYLVHFAIYEQVAGHAEKNQQVNTRTEEIIVEQVVEAAEGCVHEPAGRDEDQPAVKLRPLAPIDRQRHERAESEHVEERDAEKRVRARLVEAERVKAGHDDGGGNAQRNHHRRETGAKPSEEAMPADFVDAHQRGLSNEDEDPRCKSRGMKPEDQRPRNGGMEEVVVDRPLEAGDHDGSQQQRHYKIKIPLQESVERGRRYFARAGG